MHDMRTVAIDDHGCLSAMPLYVVSLCKHAEWIEVLHGVEIIGDPKNIVLDRSSDFLHRLRQFTFACLLKLWM